MTDKDVNRIAEAVVALLIKEQRIVDDEFKNSVESLMANGKDVSLEIVTQEDLLKEDLSKLEHRLREAIAKEEYTECDKLNKMITKFKAKYDM